MEKVNKYLFVIDTERYAGNFEREMTAYCTGQVGECGVGEAEAKKFAKGCKNTTLAKLFSDLILHVPDDHGCCRPTSVWPTPGWWNDGLGNEYPDSEWGKQYTIDKYREEAKKHQTKTDKDLPGKWPAYHSVAIFFSGLPPDNLRYVIRERARDYCENLKNFKGGAAPIKLIGFRLLKEVVSYEQFPLTEEVK